MSTALREFILSNLEAMYSSSHSLGVDYSDFKKNSKGKSGSSDDSDEEGGESDKSKTTWL
jgi:hypothetical protein